jgi:alginate O-acetyltransferase complex protein AlgI
LYIPLGGNRGSELATIRNLLIVFFCTGFWHGASWTFIVWGMYHGTFLFLERIGFEKLLLKTGKPIRMIYTFFVVIIGWVFFRADTLHGAIEYISRMLFISTSSSVNYFATEYLNNKLIIILIIASLYSFRIFRWLQQWSQNKFENSNIYIPVFQFSKFVISFLLLFLSCAYLAANTYNPFIYFRF